MDSGVFNDQTDILLNLICMIGKLHGPHKRTQRNNQIVFIYVGAPQIQHPLTHEHTTEYIQLTATFLDKYCTWNITTWSLYNVAPKFVKN